MRGLKLSMCLAVMTAAAPVVAQDAGDACTISLQQLSAAAQTAHAAAAVAAKAGAKLDETQALYDQCRLRPHDKKSGKVCQNIGGRLKDAERESEEAEDDLDAALDEVDAAYDDMAIACEPGDDLETGPVFTSHQQQTKSGRSHQLTAASRPRTRSDRGGSAAKENAAKAQREVGPTRG